MALQNLELHDLTRALAAQGVAPTLTMRSIDERLGALGVTVPATGKTRTAALPAPILGRLRLGDELGRGGMGRVLEAEDPELGRRVAVKLLIDPTAISTARLAGFVAEAQITSQLEHPGIVPVHDLGASEDGQVFFVMKRVEGRTLREVLAADRVETQAPGPPWRRQRRLAAFAQVCQAVAFAHRRGVIHRDLKPANIMLGEFGEVLVMDWGLAHITGSPHGTDGADETGGLAGTPGFLAPELIRGAPPDCRSDVWSLGAILYEILTDEAAVAGTTVDEILYHTVRWPVVEPRRRAPQVRIDEETAAVCMRALATEPATRYRDASTLAAAIDACLDGRRHRQAALERVAIARRRLDEITQLTAEADARRAAATRQIESIERRDPRAPASEKRSAWALEDEAARLEEDADRAGDALVEEADAAMAYAPDLPQAHALLADYYRDRHARAEAHGRARAAKALEASLRAHDRGAHATYLAGGGALTLVTEPPGAQVEIHRVVERDRRWVIEPGRTPSRTPLRAASLPMGRYVVQLRAVGRIPVRYPVEITRGAHWHGIAPGELSTYPILLPMSEIDEDIYVPAGWFRAGGDPLAIGGWPALRLWCDGFFIHGSSEAAAGSTAIAVVAARSGAGCRPAKARSTSVSGSHGRAR